MHYSLCLHDDLGMVKRMYVPMVLAGQGGFEPPYGRARTCCLTAWRLPSIIGITVPVHKTILFRR